MDTTTHVSLCAGYGGIDLGLKRAIPNLRTVAFAEIEGFACANLVAKMEAGRLDAAPIWTDIKTFPYSDFHGRVDILSGGYPCQPFSAAGKRLGKDDPRHLWPWIADGISAMRPGMCFFENVEGHISLGLENVLRDLQGLGYRCTFGIFSAAEVGAPHQRKRVFILADRNGIGGCGWNLRRENAVDAYAGSPERVCHKDGISKQVADSAGSGLQGYSERQLCETYIEFRPCCPSWPSRPGEQQHEWEPPRVVANTRGQEPARLPQPEGRDAGAQAGVAGDCVGDATSEQTRGLQLTGISPDAASAGSGMANAKGVGGEQATQRRESGKSLPELHGADERRQTQSPLGRDAYGPAGRMGYAELCVACDNRTDELRLLGNGVVPATAERAFRVLQNRLTGCSPSNT